MLYADLTAFENLMFAARMHGVLDAEDRVRTLLKAVELDHRRYDAVRTFSRGMTQRLSIARALLHDPSVVFLDEPYAGLDPHAVDIFDGLIARMRAGRTFVMVSHDLQKGFDAASHLLVLAKGPHGALRGEGAGRLPSVLAALSRDRRNGGWRRWRRTCRRASSAPSA